MRDDREVTVIESDSGGGIKWFLLGAAVGAGLGLLFAPQSGERTRRELAARGRRLKSQAEDVVEDVTEELQNRGRKIRDTVEEFAEDVVDEARQGKRKLQRTASTAREEMERRLADARARARAGVAADGVDEGEDESA